MTREVVSPEVLKRWKEFVLALYGEELAAKDAEIKRYRNMLFDGAFEVYRLLEVGAPPAAGMNHFLKKLGEKRLYKNPEEAMAEQNRRLERRNKGGK